MKDVSRGYLKEAPGRFYIFLGSFSFLGEKDEMSKVPIREQGRSEVL